MRIFADTQHFQLPECWVSGFISASSPPGISGAPWTIYRNHSDEPEGCTTDLLALFDWCRLAPLSKGINEDFSTGTMLPARSVEHFCPRVTYDLDGEIVGSPIKVGGLFMNAVRTIILLSSLALFTGSSEVEATPPPDQPSADGWLRNLKKEVESSQLPAYHKSIQQLADLIESDGVVREYVTQMIEQVLKNTGSLTPLTRC